MVKNKRSGKKRKRNQIKLSKPEYHYKDSKEHTREIIYSETHLKTFKNRCDWFVKFLNRIHVNYLVERLEEYTKNCGGTLKEHTRDVIWEYFKWTYCEKLKQAFIYVFTGDKTEFHELEYTIRLSGFIYQMSPMSKINSSTLTRIKGAKPTPFPCANLFDSTSIYINIDHPRMILKFKRKAVIFTGIQFRGQRGNLSLKLSEIIIQTNRAVTKTLPEHIEKLKFLHPPEVPELKPFTGYKLAELIAIKINMWLSDKTNKLTRDYISKLPQHLLYFIDSRFFMYEYIENRPTIFCHNITNTTYFGSVKRTYDIKKPERKKKKRKIIK